MATLFVHGVGNRDRNLFTERVAEIVEPRLNDALRRAGKAGEPHVRGVFWGDLGADAAGADIGDPEALRRVVQDRLAARVADPDAQITLLTLDLSADQLSTALDEQLRAAPAPTVDDTLTDLRTDLADATIAALQRKGLLESASQIDLADLKALIADVGAFAAPHLGALGRQPDLLVAVDNARAGQRSLLDTFAGGWAELQNYLGARGPAIREDLALALRDMRRQYPAEPLRLIGHSLGGVIAFDLLNSVGGEFALDLLVTAGSQIGLLAGYGMLVGQGEAATASAPINAPPGVARWLNVYDPQDALAFSIANVAAVDDSTIIDREFNGGAIWPRSHSAYWSQPAFFDLLAQYY